MNVTYESILSLVVPIKRKMFYKPTGYIRKICRAHGEVKQKGDFCARCGSKFEKREKEEPTSGCQQLAAEIKISPENLWDSMIDERELISSLRLTSGSDEIDMMAVTIQVISSNNYIIGDISQPAIDEARNRLLFFCKLLGIEDPDPQLHHQLYCSY